MRKLTKRFVAMLCGIATLVGPTTALAEGENCATYYQVQSSSTGGQYVGGLLIGETERTVTTTTTETISATGTASDPTKSGSVSGTTSGTRTTVYSETYDIGYYQMNDGTVWEVNCDTGVVKQVR